MSSPAHVRHYFSRPGESRLRLSVFDFLQPPPPPSLPFHSPPFGCCYHPIFGNSHLLTHTISLSLLISLFLWTSDAFFPSIICIFLSQKSICSLFCAFPASFSLPPVLLSQYLYAAPLCNTSLIHTLLHPPSPPFRSHTINAEKRAQTEVTCTEHIKEVWLNKSPNVC